MKWLRRHQNHWNVNHTASHSLAVWLTFQLSRCWRLSFRVLSVIAATAAVICLTALNAPACTPMERLTANVETGVDYIYAPLSNTIWWVCVVTWWTCSSGVKHLDDKNATNVVHFHSRVFSRPKLKFQWRSAEHSISGSVTTIGYDMHYMVSLSACLSVTMCSLALSISVGVEPLKVVPSCS